MATYLEALHAELEGYERAGRADRAAEVQAEIDRVAALDVAAPAEPALPPPPPPAASVAAAYAEALRRELEGYERFGRDDRAADVRAELARVEAELVDLEQPADDEPADPPADDPADPDAGGEPAEDSGGTGRRGRR